MSKQSILIVVSLDTATKLNILAAKQNKYRKHLITEILDDHVKEIDI